MMNKIIRTNLKLLRLDNNIHSGISACSSIASLRYKNDDFRRDNGNFCQKSIVNIEVNLGGNNKSVWRIIGSLTFPVAAGAYLSYEFLYKNNGLKLFQTAYLDSTQDIGQNAFNPPQRPDLPVYSIDEIKLHDQNADRIWMMFKEVI